MLFGALSALGFESEGEGGGGFVSQAKSELAVAALGECECGIWGEEGPASGESVSVSDLCIESARRFRPGGAWAAHPVEQAGELAPRLPAPGGECEEGSLALCPGVESQECAQAPGQVGRRKAARPPDCGCSLSGMNGILSGPVFD